MFIRYARVDTNLPAFRDSAVGDAGYDLYARKTTWIWPWKVKKIPTNLCLEIPTTEYKGTVKGRSGATLNGIIVHAGTIDSSYRGEIGILVSSIFMPRRIKQGFRIAQLIIEPCAVDNVFMEISTDDMSKTNRSTNGFGHTGKT